MKTCTRPRELSLGWVAGLLYSVWDLPAWPSNENRIREIKLLDPVGDLFYLRRTVGARVVWGRD